MAFTEQRVLNQIAVSPAQNTIHVQWVDQVLKDGEVIANTFYRKAYAASQRREFEAEVDCAAAYVNLINWI